MGHSFEHFGMFLAAALFSAAPAGARDAPRCDLVVAEHVKVARVIDGVTFATSDGRRIRLAEIQAPPDGQPAQRARTRLAAMIEGKSVDLAFADAGSDRHGRLLVHVFDGATWLQASIVGEGLARVATRADMHRCAAPLLADESAARAAKRGLWSDIAYRIRKPDELDADIGTFQIVEGKVLSVKQSRDRTFLNFGADYRTDFTVTIERRDAKRMTKEGVALETLAGKTIRVRGWLTRLNGPEIEVTHKEQIERID